MPTAWDPYITALFAGLGVGGLYALVAIGYNLVFQATGVFNLAQGELLTYGGLIGFTLWVTLDLPVVVALPLAGLAVAALGVVQERITVAPLLRRARSARGDSMAWVITTLGASVVLVNAAQLVWGSETKPMPPLTGAGPVHVGGATVQVANLIIFGTAVAIAVGLMLWSGGTRVGKTWSATAEDRGAAAVRGIDTRRVGWTSFAVAAAISGIGGFVVAPITSVSFDTGAALTLKGFVAIAIGGFGSPVGALVGGLVLGVVEEEAVLALSSAWRDVVSLGVLLLILMLRPNGLFGVYRQRVV